MFFFISIVVNSLMYSMMLCYIVMKKKIIVEYS